MSHTLADLQHHHLKDYPVRQPAGLQVHGFGATTPPFADDDRVAARRLEA
ncbi:MAG: hypothetical protein OXC05_05890 [Halieaceae bacterium]|nr:hypothetical protein [Halieaceae bacterium]